MHRAAQLKTLTPFLALTVVCSPLVANAARMPTTIEVSAKLATLQVPFVPNVGQWDKRAAFAAHTFAGANKCLPLGSTELRFSLFIPCFLEFVT